MRSQRLFRQKGAMLWLKKKTLLNRHTEAGLGADEPNFGQRQLKREIWNKVLYKKGYKWGFIGIPLPGKCNFVLG